MRKLGQKDQGTGNKDPNVLTIEDGMRVRLLSDDIASWKQHVIEHPDDDEQVAFVTCPGPRTCPLCRKPATFRKRADGTDELVQLFPVQRRRAANVWDHKTNSVKVLIGGPQIFNVFDDNAALGIDPLGADYVISKSGQRTQTKYQLTRLDSSPPPSFTELHDVKKYESPTSVEAIFEKLDAFGIDYDALPLPKFELDDALAFVMPYGKHKGSTLETLMAQDLEYAKYIHRSKLDQGSLGDPVFQALQTVLEEMREAQPLDDLDVDMPTAPTPAAPKPALVALLDQGGNEVEVPASAVPALLAAGYTEPAATLEPEPPATVMLIGPDGSAIEVPAAVKETMLAAGYKEQSAVPQPTEPADGDEVAVDISGTKATMTYAQAKPLIAAGAAVLVQMAPAAPAVPQFTPPAADEPVQIKLNVVPNPVEMRWADALRLAIENQGVLLDEAQQRHAMKLQDGGDAEAMAQAAQAEQQDATAVPSPDDPSKPFACDRCDKRFKTQGALTQHANREHGGVQTQVTQPSNGAPAPAPADGNGAVEGTLLERVKTRVAGSSIAKDYTKLLTVFQEATGGERNISNMNEQQLQSVLDAMDKVEAAA